MCHYVYTLVGQYHLLPPNNAGGELRKIIKSIREGTFEYESKEPVTTDWAQYPKSGVSEGDGRRGAALAQAGVYMNFVPTPNKPKSF